MYQGPGLGMDLVVDSQFFVSSGFAYTMSSKAEKKQKGSGRGSSRKRNAQAALATQALEATLPASEPVPEPEPEPEPLKEEPGGYMLPEAWRENICISGGS